MWLRACPTLTPAARESPNVSPRAFQTSRTTVKLARVASIIKPGELQDTSNFIARSSIADDVWHAEARGVGAYEWWYFDAISDDGRDVLVIIFLADFVFSPRYNRAVSEHLRRARDASAPSFASTSGATPRPAQVPAVALCLYRDGRPLVRAINEYAAQDFDARTDHPDCRIARNRFRLDTTLDESRYIITLDEPLRRKQRLKATLQWTIREGDFSNKQPFHQPTASPVATPDNAASSHGDENPSLFGGKSAETSDGVHDWNMAAPRCRVSGTLAVVNRDGRAREQQFRGTGYHDHNRDRRWMPDAIDQWQWGRAHFADTTAVFYRYRERRATTHTTRLFLIRDGQLTRHAAVFAADDSRLHPFGLRYPRRMRFHAHEDATPPTLDIRQRRVIDSSYFYLRFLGEAALTTPDGQTQHAHAVTEHLAPRALRYRWLDWLTSMRIGRHGRASFLK